MISEELLQSFIAEASDLLDDVEPSLVEYSHIKEPEERLEIVNRVFRNFHSIKGSAGFVGLHDIARLTHEAETLLEQFRKAPNRIIPQETITLLCRTVDLLRTIFAGGEEGGAGEGSEAGTNIDAQIAEIAAAVHMAKSRNTVISASLSSQLENRANSQPSTAESSTSKSTKVIPPMEVAAASEMKTLLAENEKQNAAATTDSSTQTKSNSSSSRIRKISGNTARVIHTGKITAVGEKMTTSEFAGRYVAEANELLEQIEQSLLHAEQHPESSSDSVQEALRCLHSFKGNSGLMNLTDLERLSHRMESEVENNIGRTLGLDSQTFDALLQMIDVLRQGVLDFSCGGSGSIPETDAYIAMMDEFSTQPHTGAKTRKNTKTRSSTAFFSKAPSAPPPSPVAAPEAAPAPPPPPPAPEPAATGRTGRTTRIVLRGRTSRQEDLRFTHKTTHIDIATPATPQGSGLSVTPTPPPARSAVADLAKTAADPQEQARAKASESSTRRKSGEQLAAARNDIRVDLRKLDAMLDLVGELVIAEAMVTRHPVVWDAENESLERAVHQLRRVASSLQDMATSVRMIPLAPTFRRMTRLVYDLSVKAGKQIDLVLLGEDTEVDRTVIERISDPLVHIIRNAIDHGIEPPEERVTLGKPETGRLTIEGHHEGGEVWIVITDDGRGLNRKAILAKAISRGMIAGDGSDLTDAQVYHFIFEPGFSTTEKVTDISGRGFGMDVVKKNIEKLSGRIDIRTRPGEGTAVVLRIPLTLAIIDGMLISSGGTRYIIPLLSIRESLRPEASQVFSTPDGQEMVKLRDELIPIVRLNETFSRIRNSRELNDGILMIVEGENGEVVALFADELLGQQETVIKGLSGWLKRSRGVSGCTILGDGEVGLILDIGAIVRMAREKSSA